ncbi:hypothetical protein A2W32_00380, partial [candidate division WWE3 bacterium RBG_16_37_10]
SGSSNPDLATKIAEKLKKRIYFPCTQFADGEIRVQIPVSLRKQNVYIIQSTSPDTNKHILELFLMADAVKRASGKEVTLVIPYFGYSRQDRKDQPRVPISSALISRLLKVSGADRIVTVDIHSDQQQGFFDGPWDNLYASYVLLPAIKQLKIPDLVIVSPDKGGTMRANAYAKRIQAEGIAVVYKERDVHLRNISKALDVIGDVEGKNCIIVDDIIDTGGTILNAVNLLIQRGAKKVFVSSTHGLFSNNAIQKLHDSAIEKIIITDSIYIEGMKFTNKFKIVSVSKLLSETIKRIENGTPLSAGLFD